MTSMHSQSTFSRQAMALPRRGITTNYQWVGTTASGAIAPSGQNRTLWANTGDLEASIWAIESNYQVGQGDLFSHQIEVPVSYDVGNTDWHFHITAPWPYEVYYYAEAYDPLHPTLRISNPSNDQDSFYLVHPARTSDSFTIVSPPYDSQEHTRFFIAISPASAAGVSYPVDSLVQIYVELVADSPESPLDWLADLHSPAVI